MVTIRKLGGMVNTADTANPTRTDTKLIPVEIAIAGSGLAVMERHACA
ncbi:hypothetical protein [Mycolicibacterium sp. 120320]